MYQQKIKTVSLRNQKRLLSCALLAIVCNEWVMVTVAEPESLGYLDALASPFGSSNIYWYFIPLPFLYLVRFLIFKLTAKKTFALPLLGLPIMVWQQKRH